MKQLVLAAVLLGVVASPEAEAEARPFGMYEKGLYWLATDYWGGEPRNCKVVNRVIVGPTALPPGQLAEADQPPRRPLRREALEGCGLSVNAELAPDSYTTCLVLLHEVGHLKGRGHSQDPSSVMFPVLTGAYVPACNDENRARYADPRRVELRERASALRRRCEALRPHPVRNRRVGAARPADPRSARRCWNRVRVLRRQAR